MITLLAPAKINLTLEVLSKRPDGYHEIRSVIQAINLADTLRFSSGRNVEFRCDMPGWIPEESLVSRAVSLLQETTGCTRGTIVEIDKRIPLMSGLGGDSSDAAAVLKGLNGLWELGLSRTELLDMVPQLGSDVAFFLYGGTALVEGRGETVTPLPLIPHRWVVLVVPTVGRKAGKTKRLYNSLDFAHFSDGQITERLVAILRAASEFTSSLLFNTFENVTFDRSSELDDYRSHIMKIGARNIHLAGSGPALFTLIKDRAEAEDLHIRLQQQGMETYLTDTVSTVQR